MSKNEMDALEVMSKFKILADALEMGMPQDIVSNAMSGEDAYNEAKWYLKMKG